MYYKNEAVITISEKHMRSRNFVDALSDFLDETYRESEPFKDDVILNLDGSSFKVSTFREKIYSALRGNYAIDLFNEILQQATPVCDVIQQEQRRYGIRR